MKKKTSFSGFYEVFYSVSLVNSLLSFYLRLKGFWSELNINRPCEAVLEFVIKYYLLLVTH